MGATLQERYGVMNNGEYYQYKHVGWATEQNIYDYHWDSYWYNSRFTIVTDAYGGTSVKIDGITEWTQRSKRNHIIINQDPNAYLNAMQTVSSGVEIPSGASSVTFSATLMPNATYYIWFVNNGSNSDRCALGGATVTVEGSFGTAGTPSASNGNFGSAIPINISGHSSGATFVMSVTCAGNTETLLNGSANTSASWTPAVATYAPLITNASSATATITVNTYYGGNLLYSQSTQITVSWAAGTIPPTVSSDWATAAPLNQGAASGFTVWIQKYSKARVTFTPSKVTTQYNATISSFSVTLGSTTYTASNNRADTGVISTTTASLICTVTDSRGQTASETLSIILNPYSNPTLSDISIFRCNSSGVADEDSSYVSAKATATISSLANENTLTLVAQSRTVGGAWSAQTAMTSGSVTLLSGVSPDATYEIKITLTDRLGNTATYTQSLSTRAWAMKFRPMGNGVAFGKAAESDNALELGNNWTLVLHDSTGQNSAALSYDDLVRLLQLI